LNAVRLILAPDPATTKAPYPQQKGFHLEDFFLEVGEIVVEWLFFYGSRLAK
jgi:hypothetical protein